MFDRVRNAAALLRGVVLATLLALAPVAVSADSHGPSGHTVMKDVMVAMRDGVKLATDVYLPTKDGVPVPNRRSISPLWMSQTSMAALFSSFPRWPGVAADDNAPLPE